MTIDGLISIKVNDKYEINIKEQATKEAFVKLIAASGFLKEAYGIYLHGLPQWIWIHSYNDSYFKTEITMIQSIRLILTDYYSNCTKLHNIHGLLWCEKSLSSQKLLALCLSDVSSHKLHNGIGLTVIAGFERVLIESSREKDGDHTIEDTTKLIECGTKCLHEEMGRYRQASYNTFLKRRTLCIHYISDKISLYSVSALNDQKWACILVRSCIIPRNYNQKQYWLPVFELLAKLKELLEKQELLTKELIDQHTEWIQIDPEKQIRNKTLHPIDILVYY